MRVGLVGLGVMGRNHLRVLQSLEKVTQVLIFDVANVAIHDSRKVTIAKSIEEILDFPLDYAVVALPTIHHANTAIEFAARGVPTLIEKPLAANLREAQRIFEAFEKSKTVCAVGHVERFNSALQLLKQKMNEGLIGVPLQISTIRTGPFPNRITDVGVVRDLASHDIDLVLWLSGTHYSELMSQISRVRNTEHEDLFIASGKLANAALVSHEVNWLTPMKKRQTSVLGEKGLLVADSLRSELRFFENGTLGSDWGTYRHFRGVTEGTMTKYAVPTYEPLRAEHEAMLRLLDGGGDPNICTLAEALDVMKMLEKILEK